MRAQARGAPPTPKETEAVGAFSAPSHQQAGRGSFPKHRNRVSEALLFAATQEKMETICLGCDEMRQCVSRYGRFPGRENQAWLS